MNDTLNYNFMLQTLEAENGITLGDMHTYDELNNNLAYKKSHKLKVIDYFLTRNTHLIEKMERRVEKFFANVKGKSTNLSDHYALEFVVNFKNTSTYNTTFWTFTN